MLQLLLSLLILLQLFLTHLSFQLTPPLVQTAEEDGCYEAKDQFEARKDYRNYVQEKFEHQNVGLKLQIVNVEGE